MANTINVSGDVNGAVVSQAVPLGVTQKVDMDVNLNAGAADIPVDLGAFTLPKFIYIKGGPGVSCRLVATTGTVLPCDPVGILSSSVGFSQTTLYLSNSGSAIIARVVAGE